MENGFRYSDYDLFAYVASGLAALAASDVLCGTHIVLDVDWKFSTGAVTVAFAYVVGQIISSLAAFLLEKQLTRKMFGAPSQVLFDAARPHIPTFVRTKLLREYYTPLDADIRRRVLQRAQQEGKSTEPGEPLFWAAFPAAKSNEQASPRMETFLKLYGFCRNVSFVAFVATGVLVGKGLLSLLIHSQSFHQDAAIQWLVCALVVGVGLYLRYLKFLRLYALEVFVTYSEGEYFDHGEAVHS